MCDLSIVPRTSALVLSRQSQVDGPCEVTGGDSCHGGWPDEQTRSIDPHRLLLVGDTFGTMSPEERIQRQGSAVGKWLTSARSAEAAAQICRRRGLPTDFAIDLVNDAWIRVKELFERRSEPYPDLDDEVAAERFARRILSNLAIDRARSAGHSRVTPLNDALGMEPTGSSPWSGTVETISSVENRDVVFRLRNAVGSRISDAVDPCPGCPGDVVAAVSLYVCNSLACGLIPEGRNSPLDSLIYEGLQTHDPAHFREMNEPMSDAQRKRKSRCGTCIVRLLRECAESVGLGVM